MVRDATTRGLTTTVIAFEVAGEPVTQAALEVRMQVIISPLFRVVEEKIALFVPTFPPFTCHW